MASVECPRCRGKIDPRSTRCRFCHADFSPVEQEALRKEHGSRGLLLAILGIILFFGVVSQCSQNGTVEEKSAVREKRPSSDDSRAVEATNNALDGIASPTEVAGETASSGPTSGSRGMSFERCIDSIQDVSTELGKAPINIVETNTVRIVRFNTVDGSVLVTCSRPDRKMVITRSPHRG